MGRRRGDRDGTTLGACIIAWMIVGFASAQLTNDFYSGSCPRAPSLVTAAVQTAALVDSTQPPKLLRLLFHDCFLQGCDASILIDSTASNKAEKADPANASVDGYSVIDSIKTILELVCPNIVSCADIVALAARDAVTLMGGPLVVIPTGRRDGTISRQSDVQSNIPDTTFTLDQLLNFFGAKGLSLNDLITLSGSHTIGAAHCSAFNDRFKFNFNGSGQILDASINPTFAKQLLQACPGNPSPTTTVPNDLTTPTTFDNKYYQNLQMGMGLFASDQLLFTDSRSKSGVNSFAQDQASFFSSWEQSFLKLSTVQVKTGSEGEIRKNCRAVN
ncbi:hypothetical protein O6H91_09G117500 [Diphasiastrum complanatum]|uniref:Uncharacterized protein n=2 Tax=Diphasiastrum complanatum TaxID=34168 RepID=A0ACC2CTM5_DIPCM|nr:hypothetical protein O6H91_09G117500 [Diphasiastrum complanatum]KAJ7545397.1 hypothetical protein O6H91_09G117500 [Diphasiastrum complanatum]